MSFNPESFDQSDEDSVWLLSYADLMTLLFTFFVMMYALAIQDDGAHIRKSISNYLQGGSETKVAALTEVQDNIIERLDTEKILHKSNILMTNGGLDLTFSASLLFDSGSAELRPEALKTIRKVAEIIKEKGSHLKIQVEGHTDDNPISNSKYKSNWELSGARAAHIVSLFESAGLPEKNLMAIGYGSSRPIAANRSPSGEKDSQAQQQNRRVVLSLFTPKEKN